MSIFTDDVMLDVRYRFNRSKFNPAHPSNRKYRDPTQPLRTLVSKTELLDLYEDIYEFIREQDTLAMLCPKISRGYAERSLEESLIKADMDFLGILEGDKLVSFAISHLGECRVNPDMWSIKLVCSTGLPGSGQFILGAMLYCCKIYYEIQGLPEIVILELSGKFTNLAGLISYTRLGFTRDASLFYDDSDHICGCFCEEDTLPMSNDLSRFSRQELLKMMSGSYIVAQDDDTGTVAAALAFRAASAGMSAEKRTLLEAKDKECKELAEDLYQTEKNSVVGQRKGLPRLGTSEDREAVVMCNRDYLEMIREAAFSGRRRKSKSRRSKSRRSSRKKRRSYRKRR